LHLLKTWEILVIYPWKNFHKTGHEH
jgi:hypothetical protein